MNTITLKGEIEHDIAALFVEQLAALSQEDTPLTIDMSQADIDEAKIVAELVKRIRETAARIGSLTLLEPPQVLAHGLYRVGALGARSNIRLIEPREEIGTAG